MREHGAAVAADEQDLQVDQVLARRTFRALQRELHSAIRSSATQLAGTRLYVASNMGAQVLPSCETSMRDASAPGCEQS